eukprot:6180966-Alexandrium_andersonii.AAC.2
MGQAVQRLRSLDGVAERCREPAVGGARSGCSSSAGAAGGSLREAIRTGAHDGDRRDLTPCNGVD